MHNRLLNGVKNFFNPTVNPRNQTLPASPHSLAKGVATALIYVSGDPSFAPSVDYAQKINSIIVSGGKQPVKLAPQEAKQLEILSNQTSQLLKSKQLPLDASIAYFHSQMSSIAPFRESNVHTGLVLMVGQIHATGNEDVVGRLCTEFPKIDLTAYKEALLAASSRQDLAPLANMSAAIAGRPQQFKSPLFSPIGIRPFEPIPVVDHVSSLPSQNISVSYKKPSDRGIGI